MGVGEHEWREQCTAWCIVSAALAIAALAQPFRVNEAALSCIVGSQGSEIEVRLPSLFSYLDGPHRISLPRRLRPQTRFRLSHSGSKQRCRRRSTAKREKGTEWHSLSLLLLSSHLFPLHRWSTRKGEIYLLLCFPSLPTLSALILPWRCKSELQPVMLIWWGQG